MAGEPQDIESRIRKDIELFYKNLGSAEASGRDKGASRVVELSKMYASDAKSYLDKGDLYTAFSCISYAHGLLDAAKEICGGRA